MPRTGRRRSLSIAAAAIAMLAGPAAAQAATYTVKAGDGPCTAPTDTACGGLADAATAAASGDVFNVSPGTYGSATFAVGGVTIAGAPNFAVDGTLTFSGASGGVSKLQKVGITQNNGANPGVVVTGTSGLQMSDTVVLSVNGDGVTFAEGTTNKIERSVIATGGQATSAVRVTSADLSGAAKKLTIDSTVLTGGAAGLSVSTGSGGPLSAAGDVDVILHHVTAAGSTNGLNLDATRAITALGGPVGSITADVRDSIIQNGTAKDHYVGLPLLAPPNTVTDAHTRTLTTFDPNAIFANPADHRYRLRPGSPAIDAAGFTTGESATDVEGDARPGPTTDQGADEFVNEPPTAVIAVKTVPQRDGQPVLFDGTGSSDREGAIASYHWSFGDNTTATTTTPTTTHTYKGEGAVTASLVVVDALGAPSAPATAPVKLIDGGLPEVVITRPTANQKIKLTTTTTKTTTVTKNGKKSKVKKKTTKPTKLVVAGTAKDKSGVKGVVITIEKLSSAVSTPKKKKAAPKTKAKASAAAKQCRWLDAKRGIVLRSCAKPILLLAKLGADGGWTFSVKSTLKLGAGVYRASAYASDNSGAFGNSAASKDSVHRFTLTK
ncbi:MAG: hypothetical protein QOJ63_423 [Solirubrobacteraceae bacterium]|nr:hypothetical protein [Solirubrobacteraceae bacterium]